MATIVTCDLCGKTSTPGHEQWLRSVLSGTEDVCGPCHTYLLDVLNSAIKNRKDQR
jgi:hypothetical protein